MSVGVGPESISRVMNELVDSFPLEGDGRASISDFGKLLFAEGHSATTKSTHDGSTNVATRDTKEGIIQHEDEQQNEDEHSASTTGTKRVYTEIKGIPRQKHHNVHVSVTKSGSIAITHGASPRSKTGKLPKDKAIPQRWSPQEDERLRQAVAKHGERNWKSIAEEVPHRNHTQCLQRWTKVLAPGLIKGHWRPEEDELLKELVAEGRKNWGQVANRIPGRTSKQCRERWYNHLDPSIVRGEYSVEEDRIIIEAQTRLGNKWSTIAAMLPGRTEDAVKIRWKSLCRVRKGNRPGVTGANPSEANTPGAWQTSGVNTPMGYGHSGVIKNEDTSSYGSAMMGHRPMMMGPPQPQTPMLYGPPAMHHNTSYHSSGFPSHSVVMHPVNSYGQPVGPPVMASNTMNLDHRSNIVNISPGNTANDDPRYLYGSTTPTYHPPTGMMPNSTMDSVYANSSMGYQAQPQGMMHTNSMNMGYGFTMEGGYGASSQYAPSPYHDSQQQQQYYDQHQSMQRHDFVQGQAHAQTRSEHGSPYQQSHHQDPTSQPSVETESHSQQSQPQPSVEPKPTGSTPNKPMGPAAMFAQKLSANSSNTTPTSTPNPALAFAQSKGPYNPAAMFAQKLANLSQPTPDTSMQSDDTKQDSLGKTDHVSPFKPTKGVVPFGASSAYKPFQPTGPPSLQKPPIPNSNGTAGTNDSHLSEESGENEEPSFKKVKPRNSVDFAARASAARRMRASGSGGSLMGRRSLDVFLNEIGDVGRISDLKMDEFENLEVFRMSGDMDRLSL